MTSIAVGQRPGKEVLHPVAVVIFGGLVSSTLLDTLLTPVMFLRWGKKPLERLLQTQGEESIAREYGYNLDALVTYLRDKECVSDNRAIRSISTGEAAQQGARLGDIVCSHR